MTMFDLLRIFLSIYVITTSATTIEDRLELNMWSTAWTKGSGAVQPLRNIPPNSRAFHSITGVKGRLFVFGGLSKDGYNQTAYYRNDLHFFDLESNRWSGEIVRDYDDHSGHHSALLDTPSPRAYHGTAAIGDNIWIFGGNNQYRYMRELEYFDTKTMTWSGFINARGPLPSARSEHCFFSAVSGHTPDSARHASSFISTTEPKFTRNTKLFAFGGRDSSGRALSDLWMYDVVNNAWIPMMTSGQAPAPRHSMSCIVINPGADYDDYIQNYVKFMDSESNENAANIDSIELIIPLRPTMTKIKEHYQSTPNPYPTQFNIRTATRSLLLVYGGANSKRQVHYNDLYALELDGSKGDVAYQWKRIDSKTRDMDVGVDDDDTVNELYAKHQWQLHHVTESPNHVNYPRYRHHMLFVPGRQSTSMTRKFDIVKNNMNDDMIFNLDDQLFNMTDGSRIMSRMTPQGHVPTDFISSLFLPDELVNHPMTVRQTGVVVIIDGTMGAFDNELRPSDRIMSFDVRSSIWNRVMTGVHAKRYFDNWIRFEPKVGSAVTQIGQSVYQFGGLLNGTAVDGLTSPDPIFPIELVYNSTVKPRAHFIGSKCSCDLFSVKLTIQADLWMTDYHPCNTRTLKR